jgi:hypothetical protein
MGLWALGIGQIFRSDDDGDSWSDASGNLDMTGSAVAQGLAEVGLALLLFIQYSEEVKVFRCDKPGSWFWSSTLPGSLNCQAVVVGDGTVVVAAEARAVLAIRTSSDQGATWQTLTQFPARGPLSFFDVSDSGEALAIFLLERESVAGVELYSQICLIRLPGGSVLDEIFVESNIRSGTRVGPRKWLLGSDGALLCLDAEASKVTVERALCDPSASVSAMDFQKGVLLTVEESESSSGVHFALEDSRTGPLTFPIMLSNPVWDAKIVRDGVVILTEQGAFKCAIRDESGFSWLAPTAAGPQ